MAFASRHLEAHRLRSRLSTPAGHSRGTIRRLLRRPVPRPAADWAAHPEGCRGHLAFGHQLLLRHCVELLRITRRPAFAPPRSDMLARDSGQKLVPHDGEQPCFQIETRGRLVLTFSALSKASSPHHLPGADHLWSYYVRTRVDRGNSITRSSLNIVIVCVPLLLLRLFSGCRSSLDHSPASRCGRLLIGAGRARWWRRWRAEGWICGFGGRARAGARSPGGQGGSLAARVDSSAKVSR